MPDGPVRSTITIRVAEITSPLWATVLLMLRPIRPLLPKGIYWQICRRACRFEVTHGR